MWIKRDIYRIIDDDLDDDNDNVLFGLNSGETLNLGSKCIPSEDPYKEAARQLLEQAPRFPEYVPDPIELEDHVPLHIPEHPDDEAYILEVASAPTPPLPPSFLSPRIRPLHTKASMAQMRAAIPSTYHSLLPLGTPPLLPISLPVPSTSRRAEIPEADMPPQKRLLLTAPIPGCEVGESSAAAAKQPGPNSVDVCSRESLEFYSRHHDAQEDRAAVRAEIELSSDALVVLTTRPVCHPSLVSCLPSLEESLPSVPNAYGQDLEALPSQSTASGSESYVPGDVSE
nr:hypothetical protein [Tanacetum cinerariifolium]